MVSAPGGTLFPTMAMGSLPRPQWIRDLIQDRNAGHISGADAERLLDDAVPLAIRMQEWPGWTSSPMASGVVRPMLRFSPRRWTGSSRTWFRGPAPPQISTTPPSFPASIKKDPSRPEKRSS